MDQTRASGCFGPNFDWDSLEAPAVQTGPARLDFHSGSPTSIPGIVTFFPCLAVSSIGSGRMIRDRQPVPGGRLGPLGRKCRLSRGGRDRGPHGGASHYGGRHEHTGRWTKFRHFSLPIAALPFIGAVDKLKSAAAGGVGTVEAYCATISVTTGFAQASCRLDFVS